MYQTCMYMYMSSVYMFVHVCTCRLELVTSQNFFTLHEFTFCIALMSRTHFKDFDRQCDVVRCCDQQLFVAARPRTHTVCWRQKQQESDAIRHVDLLQIVQPVSGSTLRADTYAKASFVRLTSADKQIPGRDVDYPLDL